MFKEKETFSLEGLIEKLKDKNVKFKLSEIKRCREVLLVNNYLNFSSSKYLFSTGREKKYISNKEFKFYYVYKYETDYLTLEKKYTQLLKLENKLREAVLMFEIELKTYFTLFLKEFLEKKNINFAILLNNLYEYDNFKKKLIKVDEKFFEILEKEWEKQVESFNITDMDYSKQYYLLIKVLSFGTIVKFLDFNYNNEEKIFKLFQGYLRERNFRLPKLMRDLDTIVILRNSLCHKESLIIFLEKGYKKNLKEQKRAKEKMYKLNRNFLYERINSIAFIFEYYMLRKNRKVKKLSEKSWIKRYYSIRLNSIGKNYFKKLKIEI